jgi:D-alanine-D-alanine ligase
MTAKRNRHEFTVGITYDLRDEQPLPEGAPPDYYADLDTEETIDLLAQGIASLGFNVVKIGSAHKLMRFLVDGGQVDLVFNMAEGIRGRSREGYVPAVLEVFGIPYTGSDPLTSAICLDKALAKKLWQHAGLPTPAFAVIETPEQCQAALESLSLPLFIKPMYEGSSKGINAEHSVIHTAEQFQIYTDRLLRLYDQPVLAEVFLSGQEYTVAVVGTGAGAQALGSAEVHPPGDYRVSGYTEKESWRRLSQQYYTPLSDSSVQQRLAALAVEAFRVLGCRDWGRVDIRSDAAGQLQLLEINPITGINPYGSALPKIAGFAGISYEALLEAIIQQTCQRWQIAFV